MAKVGVAKVGLAKVGLAKVDLAVHIDGYVASVAHTILIGAEAVKADDKRAQVVLPHIHSHN